MSGTASTRPCCAVAKALGPEKLAELDAELLKANHAGFKKLAVMFGTNHSAVRRHKLRCLGFGANEGGGAGEAPPRAGAGSVGTGAATEVGTDGNALGTRGNRGEQPQGDAQDDGSGVPHVPGGGNTHPTVPPDEPAPRARAPVSRQPVGSHEDCVLVIVARIAEGALVPSDVPAWASAWGRGESTVRGMVREAYLHSRVDRGTVEERRVLAMGMWEMQIRLCDEALAPSAVEPGKRRRLLSSMDRALLLRERKGAIEGWCKAAGVFDDATKIQINLVQHPLFVETISTVMAALRAFPPARAAVTAALREKLRILQQPPAPMLDASGGDDRDHGQSTGEAA